MKVKDLILSSMRLANILSAGENPSGQELADAVEAYRQFRYSWDTEGLLSATTRIDTIPFVNDQSTYLTTNSASEILNVTVKTNNIEVPCEIIGLDQYSKIVDKNTKSSLPTKVYPLVSDDQIQLIFWPIPSGATSFVAYYKPFFNLTDAVANTAGKTSLEAQKYNFALRLCAEYGKQPSALLVQIANDSKDQLKRYNHEAPMMTTDYSTRGGKGYNVFSDE